LDGHLGVLTEAAAVVPTEVSHTVSRQVERFLYREARLLDQGDYDAWLSLLAPDIHYWMPVIENRARDDPEGTYAPERLAYYDDTIDDLRRRIVRFQAKTAWAENPATRHVHVISNVEVEPGDSPGEVVAHSVFVNYRSRSERDEVVLFGRRRDVLRHRDGVWLLARRRILIAQNVLLSKNLNVFL